MRNRWIWSVALMVVLPSCASGPSGPEDCRAMAAGTARDECWVAHAPTLFRNTSDSALAITTIQTQVGDSNARDFIWLMVTREVDPSSYQYCRLIEGQALAERCRVVVSRPHLHRDIGGKNRDGAKQGAGGGPPPGGGSPSAGGAPSKGGPPPQDK